MVKLKTFIPEEVCLSCDGCCRYAEQDSIWSPLFLFEEIVELTEQNIVPSCLFTHADIGRKTAVRIDLVRDGELFFCSCFDKAENRCNIYAHRPLDCQLYPFVLALKNKKAYLALDEKCPYTHQRAQEKALRDYVAYLMEFFAGSDIKELLKENPTMIQDYLQDLKFLAPLP